MANAFSQKSNAMSVSHGSPFKDMTPSAMARLERIADQVEREAAVKQMYGFDDFQGLEQPWLDPVDAIAGGLSALPRGLAAAGIETALDIPISLGMEQAFGGEDNAMMAAIPGRRGIRKLAQNPGTLIAQHNLSLPNLAHAEKMGGIPVPSLAINRADDPLTNFGEVSLIANKDMIDPRAGTGAKVYGADVYSPRYPKVDLKTSYTSESALKDKLGRFEDRIGASWSDYPDIADRGRDALENSSLFMADFLDSVGEYVPKATKKTSGYAVKDRMRKKVLSPKHKDAFMKHIDESMYDVVEEERLFLGFTPSGTRKYKPHTLENVTSQMKKDIRGGEGFNYGPGSLRAQFTPEFKSIKQIKDNEGRLVSKETFDTMKDEISDDMFSLYDEMKPYMKHQSDNQFTNYNVFQDQIGEAGKYGIGYVMREYFPDATDSSGIANFIGKLADYPTEYFESNILRSVGINEFSAAVVPSNTPQKVIDSLTNKGLLVKKYKKGDDAARKSVISKLKDLRFAVLPAVMLPEEE